MQLITSKPIGTHFCVGKTVQPEDYVTLELWRLRPKYLSKDVSRQFAAVLLIRDIRISIGDDVLTVVACHRLRFCRPNAVR